VAKKLREISTNSPSAVFFFDDARGDASFVAAVVHHYFARLGQHRDPKLHELVALTFGHALLIAEVKLPAGREISPEWRRR